METKFTKNGSRYTLLVDRLLEHPPEKVWRVLTERDLLKQWFPCDVEGEWQVGAPLRFHFLHGEGEGMSEEDLSGEVLTVDPPHLLEFRWGTGLLRAELSAEGSGCRLRFSETLDDPSWGARNAAGWEMCLENLNIVLQAGTVLKFAADIWHGKYKRYAEKFEPEFGPQQGMPEGYPSESESAGGLAQ